VSFDVVVIGAGHNGLTAAARLARAGRKVLVADRRAQAGGLAAPEEFHPGFRSPGVLDDTSTFRPAIARALGLERHGLAWRDETPGVLCVAAGEGTVLPGGANGAISGATTEDTAAFVAWRGFLAGIAPTLSRLLDRPPPTLTPKTVGDFWALARDGVTLRRLGRRELLELLRIAPMPAADWLRERFRDDALVEALAAPGVLGTWLGPHSAGSVWNLLVRECTAGRAVASGAPGLVAALEAACRAAGVELRLGTSVEQIRVRGGVVAGVDLAGGEEVAAKAVLASCDPRHALLELLQPSLLSMRLTERLRNFRCRGTAAKVHLALSAPLTFRGVAAERSRLGGGHVDALERAFDAVKYRRFSERPFLEVFQPSVGEPGWAPAGQHVASVLVGYAPHDLDGGWTDASRAAFGEAVRIALERWDPEARAKLVAMETLTPADLERGYGLTGGHLHHGEQALDQLLFMRPTPETARYATPLPGLFLGGSGSHPGGGLTGMPGWLGAAAVLGAALKS
jgi:phytoene dehydrogenase-like protein